MHAMLVTHAHALRCRPTLEIQFVGDRENDCCDAVARRGASIPWRCGVPPSRVEPQPPIVPFGTSDHETLTERHPNHSATASNNRPIITLASGGPAARQIPACRAPTIHRAALAPPNRADHLLRAGGWWQTVEGIAFGHPYPGEEVVTTTGSARDSRGLIARVSHTAAFFFWALL